MKKSLILKKVSILRTARRSQRLGNTAYSLHSLVFQVSPDWPRKPSLLPWELSASITSGEQTVVETYHLSVPSLWHQSQIQGKHGLSWFDGLVIVIGTCLGWIYGNELT